MTTHTLRAPKVGAAYMILGRITLEQAFLAKKEQQSLHIPAFLQQLHQDDPDCVHGLLELQDTRETHMSAAGRLHAAVRMTRLPNQQMRLCIRDCDRGKDGATQPMPAPQRSVIQRHGGEGVQPVTDDAWTELQHGDILHICPHIQRGTIREKYTAFKFAVSMPMPQAGAAEEAEQTRQAQPHMLKFVLPGRIVGKLIGQAGRTKTALQREHNCGIEIANSQHVYPGMASALIRGQAVGITTSSATGITPAFSAVLTVTGIPLEGFYLVVPASVARNLQGDDDTGLHRLEARLQHEVRLKLLPQADAAPPLSEQIIECRGNINGIVKVVEHVMRMLGPKSACGYKPIEPEQRGRGAGRGDAGAQAGSSSGPSGGHAGTASRNQCDENLICRQCNDTFVFSVSEQAEFKKKNYNNQPGLCHQCRAAKRAKRDGKHKKAVRDQAAHRGDNKTRNTIIKKATATTRKIRQRLRGNQGRGRK